MLRKFYGTLCGLMMLLFGTLAYGDKTIVLTIDDLPFVGTGYGNPNNLKRANDRFTSIIQVLNEKDIPAIGFIIGGAIAKGQWPLLQEFNQGKRILGNHSYTHHSLNSMSAEKYITDVDKADVKLAPLLSQPKYYRFPYLAEGSGEKKEKVLTYLKDKGYEVAPVTIDSKDYRFNSDLYRVAYRNRPAYLPTLKKRYLAYIWQQTLKAEQKSAHQGYPDRPQFLLIHANLLNSHLLKDIIDLYESHGYRFISMPDALHMIQNENTAKVQSKLKVSSASALLWQYVFAWQERLTRAIS